jgi:hypothetical protein
MSRVMPVYQGIEKLKKGDHLNGVAPILQGGKV